MGDLEDRKKILQALYKTMREHGGRPTGYKISDLANDLGIDRDEFGFHIKYLKGREFLRFITYGSVCLTPAGVEEVEKPREEGLPPQYSHQVISITGGNVGQVNQAHVINNPSLLLNFLADELERSPDLDPQKKKAWREMLREMANNPLIEKILSAVLSTLGVGIQRT